MKLSELGEFGLIARIQSILPPPEPDILVGIGDDVAVLSGVKNRDIVWLATCDVQVEGSHFVRDRVTPEKLGRKALAINQSDIAASGGTPRFALVSLGLPSDLEVSFVDRLYAGMLEQAERFETAIVGGNISQSRLGIFIDVSLLGQAERANVVLRSGAAPGDQILVTGTLGDAAAALALTQKRVTASESYSRVARSRADTPTPRVREGQIIGASHLATAMLDVSDGLVGDLRHICESSGVGAQIDAGRLPVSAENRALGRTLFNDEWHFALFGGEDYELLFTAPPEKADDLARMVSDRTGTPVAVIGKVLETPNRQELTLGDGTSVQLPSQGWDHFRS